MLSKLESIAESKEQCCETKMLMWGKEDKRYQIIKIRKSPIDFESFHINQHIYLEGRHSWRKRFWFLIVWALKNPNELQKNLRGVKSLFQIPACSLEVSLAKENTWILKILNKWLNVRQILLVNGIVWIWVHYTRKKSSQWHVYSHFLD